MALSSCTTFSPKVFPADYYYDLDFTNKACGKWKIIDKDKMVVTKVEDLRLWDCEGVVGFGLRDFVNVKHWIVEVNESKR